MCCGPRWSTALERVEDPDSAFVAGCQTVRNAARAAFSALSGGDEKADAEKRQTAAAVKEIFDIAERLAELSDHDVVWVADRERFGREARVAPLSVAALMRSQVFGERTTVLTSATLKLGGDFTGIAASVGLRAVERDDTAPVRGGGRAQHQRGSRGRRGADRRRR